MKDLLILLMAPALVACVFTALHFGMPLVIDVRCNDSGIDLLLFRVFTPVHIPLAVVQSVDVLRASSIASQLTTPGLTVGWTSRFWSPRVAITTESGRRYIVTPVRPREFVDDVRTRVARVEGRTGIQDDKRLPP